MALDPIFPHSSTLREIWIGGSKLGLIRWSSVSVLNAFARSAARALLRWAVCLTFLRSGGSPRRH